MQLVEDLTDVENAAKDSAVAEVLAPVKKCRDDLVEYCSLDNCDALEDMSNYVILIERHRGVQADHLLPYLLTLLRKFICDCTDYQLRQDVVGEAPRTDSEWIRFSDIGNKLANWMQVLWRAEVKCSKVDALLVSSYFREFETRFPGTLPAVLHESWCQITGDAGNKILDNYEASLESQHQARTDNQQMVSDSSVNSAPNAAPTGVMIPVSDGPKPLEKFISATKEAQIEFEKVMIDRTSDSGLKKDRELTIAKWSDVLKNCFGQACMDLCTRLSRGDLHEQLATAFCEATKFTVSLITVYESRSFPHSWITATIMILGATLEEATRSEFSQELEPLIQSRNELLRYCDRHYPNWFDGVEDSLTGIERGVSKIAASKELRAAVLKLGEKFRSICTYMMLRQKIGVTLEWPEDSWRKFNDVGLVLSHWLQRVGKSLAGWAQVMSQELLKFSLMFPGRVPKPLLKSDNMRKHFAAATARLKRTKTSAYSEISDSGTVVSGVKRARIDPDIIDYPTKRSATAGMDLKLGGDATIHATKVKIIAHLQMGTAIGHIFAICEVLNSKAAKRIQNYLDQTREVNAQVLDLLGQGMDSNSRQTFDRATEILTDVIWGMGQIDKSLAASRESLQKYWRVHYADVLQTIRVYAAETNSMLAGLDSFQLGIRVQRLVLYYPNACDVYFHELNGIVPSSKKEQLRAELMEIGAVLNSWIERVLAHKIQLQQLVNAAEFDMRITRLIDTLPGCAPASLVTNIRQAFGIPEPRALRPHPRQR
ncbi:hypothetical protein PC128_g10647 [Phytophthora cactorum]|nr:hypothetical protein PC128_g10647 [Phytophthora cactorum]